MNASPGFAALGVVAVACGLVAASSAVTRSDPTSTPTAAAPLAAQEAAYGKPLVEIPSYGGPPETASMNCVSRTTCDLVFIPPSKDTVRPFGLAIKLLRADGKKVVISVGGRQHVVEPGKAVQVRGATVELVGTPGSVVTLKARSA